MAGSPSPAPGVPTRGGSALVWSMAALYAVAFSSLSILKYRYYLYDDFDLAIFAQALSAMLRGSLFSSIRGMSWLGDHSSLILFLIAPLYAVLRHPVTLLVAQSAMLGLGALPVYWLARRELEGSRAALVFPALYLLHPALGAANLYEFHPEVLCIPLLLFAFTFLRAGRLGPTVLFAALAVLAREDVALVVGAMGLYALTLRRPRRGVYAAALVALAAGSLALSFGLLKPALNAGEVDFGLLYPGWGHTPVEIASTVAKHPLRALEWLFSTPTDAYDSGLKRTYYVHTLLPLLFLPLLSPGTLLIAAPVLIEHFLSSVRVQHTIDYHYTALVTPVFVMAAVLGQRNLTRLAPGRALAGTIPALALLASLASNLWFGPLLGRATARSEPPQPVWPSRMDRTLLPYRDHLLARLPERGGVVASFEFLPRLADREELHALHHVLCGHYTISRMPCPTPSGVSALLAGCDPERTLASVDLGTGQRLRDLIARNGLRPVEAPGDLALYLRSARGPIDSLETWSAGSSPIASPRRLVFDRQLAYLACELPRATAEPGGLLPVRTYWRRLATADRIFLAAYVLLDDRNAPAHQATVFLGSLVNPVHLWPANTTVRCTERIVLPEDLAPGHYVLALRVGGWNGRTTLLSECDAPDLAANRMLVRLGEFQVAPKHDRP